MATPLLLVDGADRQLAIRGFLQRRLGGHRADHIVERELLDLAPIEYDQPGGEWLRVLLDLRFHRPVFARHERADLQLPFADQPQRRRSHATGGQARLHLAPQTRRQIEADQRPEERRGGKAGVSTCRFWWSPVL